MTHGANANHEQELRAESWFARLWGIAALAHLVGNLRGGHQWLEASLLGLLSTALACAAFWLASRPTRLALAITAMLSIATCVVEMPMAGNHWLLAAMISLALLASLAQARPWAWFSATARSMTLVFYAWAAFNKLSADFFDPRVSCGVFFANQWLSSYHLPRVSATSSLAVVLSYAAATFELLVPVMLAWPSTRRVGALLAMVFHFQLSLDLDQHFYDFTSVLFPLFALFLGDETLASLEEQRPKWSSTLLVVAGAGLLVALLVTPLVVIATSAPFVYDALRHSGEMLLWIPFGAWLIWRSGKLSRPRPRVELHVRGALAATLVGLVFANGLLPYVELKTATAWNMYANLVTADGTSNHAILRRTFPLTNEQAEPVVILASDDPGLRDYVGSGYALSWNRFRHYLAAHPAAHVTFSRGKVVTTSTGAALGATLPWWKEKLLPFRAIDMQRPVRCQTTWLPAR